ncbi:MAG: VTT domain-containing protein [Nanoarchaeota archaeon]
MKIPSKKILAFIFIIIVLSLMISIKKYNLDSDNVVEYLKDHTKVGWIIFVIFYAITILIPTIPVAPFMIAAGIFFSFWIGFALTLIGTMLGAMLSFVISRYLFHDYFHKQLSKTKYFKWTKIKDQNKLIKLVLISRLTPFIPFNLANYVLAMTKVKANNYFLTTLVGIIPAIIILVFVGIKIDEIVTLEWITVAIILTAVIATYFYKKSSKGTLA